MATDLTAPACPSCGERGVPIVYGLPTRAAREAAAAGRLKLFGCVVPPDPDQWICPAYHTWRSTDDQQLIAAIDAALTGN
jgi:hypothetical protein